MRLEPPDIGFTQRLPVVAVTQAGVELGPLHIPLPRKELASPAAVGDELVVFVGSDREGQPLATTRTPFAEAGEFAFLEVVDIEPHGAYLDWGLARDLFVPSFLQFDTPRVGSPLMVAIDVDDRGRLFGSNRLSEYFDRDLSAISQGQQVALWVYGRHERGWLVIVESAHAGLLYSDQVFQTLRLGQRLTGWVQALRDDGKIDVGLQRTGRMAIEDARATLWAALTRAEGFLSLTDHSPPEAIRARVRLSKKAFKRALGGLYKDGRVQLEADGIRAVVAPPV